MDEFARQKFLQYFCRIDLATRSHGAARRLVCRGFRHAFADRPAIRSPLRMLSPMQQIGSQPMPLSSKARGSINADMEPESLPVVELTSNKFTILPRSLLFDNQPDVDFALSARSRGLSFPVPVGQHPPKASSHSRTDVPRGPSRVFPCAEGNGPGTCWSYHCRVKDKHPVQSDATRRIGCGVFPKPQALLCRADDVHSLPFWRRQEQGSGYQIRGVLPGRSAPSAKLSREAAWGCGGHGSPRFSSFDSILNAIVHDARLTREASTWVFRDSIVYVT